MHPEIGAAVLIFLQLYLAHLISDFLAQPDWVARNKRRPLALAAHAGIHIVVACVTVNLGLTVGVFATIIALAIVHTVFDYIKARLSDDRWIAFSVDQAAHLLVVAVASIWLTMSWRGSVGIIGIAAQSQRLYLYGVAYIGVVFGGGYLIQKVTQSFLERIQVDLASSKPGLPSAGKYIGWVERFLILTFVVAGYDTAIGFLLATKALARYPEIKEDSKGHFAEYFLIGTLTSVGLALIAGIALKKLDSVIG